MDSQTRARGAGLLSALAGGLFVPYAFTKGSLSSHIAAAGWHLGPLTPEVTARLYHLAEAVPLAVMAVGFLAAVERADARGPLAALGRSTALGGFVLVVATHLGEHMLPPATVPALTGGANWFMWGYYLSWLVLYAGFAIYGVAMLASPGSPARLAWAFVLVPPFAAAAGVVAVATGVFTVAGTFRVLFGLSMVFVGGWLWSAPVGGQPERTGDRSMNSGVGES